MRNSVSDGRTCGGLQVWLNGKTILIDPPTTPTASSSRRGSNQPAMPRAFPRRSTNTREVEVGLREGENELVAKVVIAKPQRRGRGRGGEGEQQQAPPEMNNEGGEQNFGRRDRGGAANLTFYLEPEGEDVLDHAVATAIRTLAAVRDADAISEGIAAANAEGIETARPVGATGSLESTDEIETPKAIGSITTLPSSSVP